MRNFTNVRLAFICAICLCIVACQPSGKGALQNNTDCGKVQSSFTHIIASERSDSLKSVEMRQLFDSTGSNCPAISKTILSKLFRTAARNPLDTVITHFFEQKGNDISLDKKIRAAAFFNRASCYMFLQNNADSGFSYLQKSIAFEKEFDDTLYRTYYALKAQALVMKSKYTEAGDNYIKAIQLCDKIKDSGYAANLYSNFARLYTQLGNNEKAIEIKKKPLPYYLSKNDEYELMTSYGSISSSYALLKKYDSAIAYNNKGIGLFEKGIKNLFTAYYLYINQGIIYATLEKYDTAKSYFDEGKIILQELDNPMLEMQFIIASTTAYATVKDVSPEIEKIRGYIPLLYKNEDLQNVRDCYDCIYRFELSNHHTDSALAYFKLKDSVQNILSTQDNKKYITELETKYETQKKELQIQVQDEEIRQKNILNGLLVALLVTAALGAAFIITRLQLKRNKKEAALQQEFTHQLLQNTEEERGRIARDLHDSVSQELLLLKNQAKTSPVETVTTAIDALINEIRMIARALHPVMLDQAGLKLSIEHVCNRMMETNQLFISTAINYNNSLSKNAELQLFRIVQEALNNIVKYAKAEAAKVTINETAQTISVEIQDNGKGFDVQASLKEKMSFGLISIIERSKAVGGKADIKSTAAGTIVKIEIPRNNA